jgi:hypothetical protein
LAHFVEHESVKSNIALAKMNATVATAADVPADWLSGWISLRGMLTILLLLVTYDQCRSAVVLALNDLD